MSASESSQEAAQAPPTLEAEAQAAKQGLRQSERHFRLLAENMTDMVDLHEPDGTYVYASPSAERILGFAPQELVGRSMFELLHPDDLERFRHEGEREHVFASALPETALYRMRTKAGTYVWMESTSRAILDENGQAERILTSSRDASECVRAQEALATSNAALKQRNRELQDFAYVASHDLQEPLRKIRAFAGLMQEDYAEAVDETGRYYLDRMQDGAERMSDLIAALLNLSRLATKAQPFEEVDLRKVAEGACSDLEIRVQETNGTVELGDLPTITAERTQMRQLLQNLMGNALKFHREGVPPVVRVTAAREHAPLGAQPEARDIIRLVVKDNGIGFDKKYLSRIFTPFQRLHGRGEYEGTGMGLAICRRIVERHQGTIDAESTPGEGSAFVVCLPAHQAEPADHAAGASSVSDVEQSQM